ncbi:MAG TPA: DNA polymerase IV [Nitrososphaeraceae archaeon]|nr:DNA polymerase IV [Nitrososphaeraceae archaeon]
MGTKIFNSGEKWIGRVIACIDLNAFYPSCEELRDPSLKGKAHAVIMTDDKTGDIMKGAVSSCSYEARKYGVSSAMSLSKAKSLCLDLILNPVDIPYYRGISEQVMNAIQEYADTLEQASIDEAFLDCTTRIQSQSPEAYAAKIKKTIKEKCGGLSCSIGVTTTKSTAKIASDFEKPDGLTVVYPTELKKFLEPLDVGTVAGIGPKTQRALKEMEIQTLGQLAKADVQILRERFGKNGYWMWKVANGTDDEIVAPRTDNVSLSTENTLDAYTRDKEKIQKHLDDLVNEIYQRVRGQGYLFKTVGIKLVRTNFSVETRVTTFEEFRDDNDSISSAIGKLLDKFDLSENRPPVRKIGLLVTHLVREEIIKRKKNAQRSLLDYYQ